MRYFLIWFFHLNSNISFDNSTKNHRSPVMRILAKVRQINLMTDKGLRELSESFTKTIDGKE